MSMININELHRINDDREKYRLKVYESVLKKCHERIKFVSKLLKELIFAFMLFQI